MFYEHGHVSNAFFWIPLAASLTPYIAMSSISDYKVRSMKVFRYLLCPGKFPLNLMNIDLHTGSESNVCVCSSIQSIISTIGCQNMNKINFFL